jgi:biopolymer transport protein ExbD
MLSLGMPAALAALLFACSPAPVVTPAKPTVVVVRIMKNGAVLWNGRVVDTAAFNRLLDDAARQTPPPQIHLEPDRNASYTTVAEILAAAQRKGVTHIGFTGIEVMP